MGLIQQALGLEDENGKPIPPQPVSRFPNGVKRATPPPPTPKYTGPQPVSRFPEGVKKITPPSGFKNVGTDDFVDNLGLDKLGIPKEAVPIILVGGVLVVLYFILR